MTRIATVLPEDRVGGTENLDVLVRAVASWIKQGRVDALTRWLTRELDPDGVPRRLDLADWPEGLRLLSAAIAGRSEAWPVPFDAAAEGWFRALLRFSRPDGSLVFGPRVPPIGCRKLYRGWADRLSDPGFATVLDWWFPAADASRHAPPPLPADARPDRPLAILRANWVRQGDLIAIDQRRPGTSTRFELNGSGRTWLGPSWSLDAARTPTTPRARPTLWVSQGSADAFEWTMRVGPARLVRTAVLLRGRSLALLAEQWDGPSEAPAMRLSLPEGIEAVPLAESRAFSLTAVGGRPASARVFPIGLPRLPYATDRGALEFEPGALVLRQSPVAGARRVWRPLVVSWDPKRNRQNAHWRTLTVSEQGRECPPGTAFAARLSWGRDETLIVYRSLGPPGLRAFLGHQTRARFLLGLFTSEGEVEPLLTVHD